MKSTYAPQAHILNTYLYIRFRANSYNSMSRAFSLLIVSSWSGLSIDNVILDSVALCGSKGTANRRLNVSSKTYCPTWEFQHLVQYMLLYLHIIYNKNKNILVLHLSSLFLFQFPNILFKYHYKCLFVYSGGNTMSSKFSRTPYSICYY